MPVLNSLELEHVAKAYGDVRVLDDVSLTMVAGEFVSFLGPSGSGKSTLLRIIAGLETLDAGEVRLEGQRIDILPPGDRGVALVFQAYALYPHMTVRENMAFGLRNAKVPAAEIEERITRAAAALEIDALLDRKPGQLSGGQRQRVAIGRAIVKHPRLFLLDEPLSNLDAALRNRTRVELAQLRQRVDAALIMVTHDQAEAMTLSDRIVVMNDRRIQQVGAPMDIYRRPANTFVAGFVGSPAITLASGAIIGDEGGARVRLGCGAEVQTRVRPNGMVPGGTVKLGLRPEHVAVVAPGSGAIDAETILVERLGDRTLVYARMPDGEPVTAQGDGASAVRIGDRIGLVFAGDRAHVFDEGGAGHHPAEA